MTSTDEDVDLVGRGMVRRRIKMALLLAGASSSFGLTACTHSGANSAPTATPSEAVTQSPSAIATKPVVAGSTATTTRDCPVVPLAVVMPTIGQRLDHATVQASGGKTVGCEFYPITGGLADSENENLPTHGYPSARITISTYLSAESARQVLAIVSRAGRSPSLQSIDGLVAETYQTRFYPPDGDADWTCAFIKGSKLVTVYVAEASTQGQSIVMDLAKAFASHI